MKKQSLISIQNNANRLLYFFMKGLASFSYTFFYDQQLLAEDKEIKKLEGSYE